MMKIRQSLSKYYNSEWVKCCGRIWFQCIEMESGIKKHYTYYTSQANKTF